MERQSNCSPCSSNENAVLDVKPLRSLAPMFPAPLGLNTFTQSTAPPFVCVTPVGPFPSGFESGCPSGFSPAFTSFATSDAPHRGPVGPIPGAANDGAADVEIPNANGCIRATPLSSTFQTPPANVIPVDDDEEPTYSGHTSASGRRIKRPAHLSSYRAVGSDTVGIDGLKVKKARPRKVFDSELALVPSSLHEAKRSVEMILMTFDALRRRLLQVDEANDINRRADLKAGAIMMANNLRANLGKRIGPVSGIEVGDIFYFRMEMCVVGLHAPSMAGIDYMNARFGEQDDTVAMSIVSAGGYENEEDDVDVLVYTGQGGSSRNSKNQMDDQKLERGNLALERSKDRKNEIRVIRSAKDFSVQNGKIYIYDGLYKIQKSWIDKSKSGFNVFKYQLLREPGQPDGLSVWKRTQKWKDNPASRERVILPDISSGIENIPVCLVNDVDGEKGPGHFTYVTRVMYLRPSSMKSLGGCACLSVCLPGDTNCSCAQQNSGDLPYSSTGFLVSRKPVIYECGSSCQCSINCRNRVTQKGIRLHFEVFRTRDRGWGLRSWDPIRAGTFICEYTGEVVDEIRLDDDGEEDEYIFQTTGAGERTFKWNYEPELLGEPKTNELSETFEPLPIIISARNMGNVSRFMNHSCSPNVFWQPVQHDHADEGYPHIMFFAIKHIPPLTELMYDYGQGEVESGGMGPRRAKKCLCGSPKCRGFFR